MFKHICKHILNVHLSWLILNISWMRLRCAFGVFPCIWVARTYVSTKCTILHWQMHLPYVQGKNENQVFCIISICSVRTLWHHCTFSWASLCHPACSQATNRKDNQLRRHIYIVLCIQQCSPLNGYMQWRCINYHSICWINLHKTLNTAPYSWHIWLERNLNILWLHCKPMQVSSILWHQYLCTL